jgi:hypothetical protein
MNSAVLGVATVARLQWRCCIVTRFWIHEKGAGRSEGIDPGSEPIVAHARGFSKWASLVRNMPLIHSFINKRGIPFRIPSSIRCG